MTRVTLALVALLAATPALAQEPAPAMSAAYADLGIDGPIFSARPIEANGQPGAEWLIARNPFSVERQVLYPAGPRGLCLSAPFVVDLRDEVADVDGDGKAERVRFDFATQRVMVWPLPACQD